MNYLSSYNSLFEVSVGLNLAYIALDQIKDKFRNIFTRNVFEEKQKEVETLEDRYNIVIKENFGDKSINVDDNNKIKVKLNSLKTDSSKYLIEEKKKITEEQDKTFKSLKAFYVTSAIFSLITLFLSGYIDNKIEVAIFTFELFTFLVLSFICYSIYYMNKKHKNIDTNFHIKVNFVLLFIALIIPYLLASVLNFEILRLFCSNVFLVFTYISLSVIFMPILSSMFFLWKRTKNVISKYESYASAMDKDIKEIAEYLNNIEAYDNLIEGMKEEKEKLMNMVCIQT